MNPKTKDAFIADLREHQAKQLKRFAARIKSGRYRDD